jgi:hypothetical protein
LSNKAKKINSKRIIAKNTTAMLRKDKTKVKAKEYFS